MADLSDFANSIAGIESGGNYSLLGPETKGDRAYGKYQIMSSNIGPWSKEILGQEVTPQQFLENPQLQDAIFQGKFGQYVQKYGPEGAAKAWFAGERGMNNPNAKDVLGTSVASYGARFMKGLGQAPQGAAPQIAPNLMPQPAAPASMPAFAWSPKPEPQQEQAQPTAQPSFDAPQLSPINYPMRRPPNLAPLQALLTRLRPGFSRG